MTNAINIMADRRRALSLVMSSSLIALTVIRPAQGQSAIEPFGLDDIETLLSNRQQRFLISMHFNITQQILYLSIFKEKRLETYAGFRELGYENWVAEDSSLIDLRLRLEGDEYAGEIIQLIDEMGGVAADRIISDAAAAVTPLVQRVATVFEQEGLPPSGPLGSEGLKSVYFVEQVVALHNASAPQPAFLCGFFPFSWFCE